LDRLVERTVLGRLDHANLNEQPEFRDVVPTTENLAMLIRRWLAESWEAEFGDKPAYLARVRIEETPRNSFEVTA
jgi:6-pyruvoyl-tetrahydropterin synthase